MTVPTEHPSHPVRAGLKSDQVSGLMLTALAVYIVWLNSAFPVGTPADPGPGYVPLLLAIAFGVVGLLVAALGGRSQPLLAIRWPEGMRAVVILVASLVVAFALERIGYRLSIFAFLVFFFGVVERKRPLPVALVSIGFTLASFYVIADLLHVPLPRGPWGF